MERRIEFLPAYDQRGTGGGIHSSEMRWYLEGELGVVQLDIYTGWMLPHVEQMLDRDITNHFLCHPIPARVRFHGRVPLGAHKVRECDLIPGGACFYAETYLEAVPVYETLVSKGSDAAWDELERIYRERFEDKGASNDTSSETEAGMENAADNNHRAA